MPYEKPVPEDLQCVTQLLHRPCTSAGESERRHQTGGGSPASAKTPTVPDSQDQQDQKK